MERLRSLGSENLKQDQIELSLNQIICEIIEFAQGNYNKTLTSQLYEDIKQYLAMPTIRQRIVFVQDQIITISKTLDTITKHLGSAQLSIIKSNMEHTKNIARSNFNIKTESSPSSNFEQQLKDIKSMPEITRKTISSMITKISRKTSHDPEYAKEVNYLNHTFRLPWDNLQETVWDIEHARKVLDQEHFGIHETKQRILEFIAKNAKEKEPKGLVLLLVGSPGVGKTSVAKSIAQCLKKKHIYVSMSGQSDPSYIKGHKYTYIGSEPGIFIKQLERVKVKNPVIIIDEIDKLGSQSHQGY